MERSSLSMPMPYFFSPASRRSLILLMTRSSISISERNFIIFFLVIRIFIQSSLLFALKGGERIPLSEIIVFDPAAQVILKELDLIRFIPFAAIDGPVQFHDRGNMLFPVE